MGVFSRWWTPASAWIRRRTVGLGPAQGPQRHPCPGTFLFWQENCSIFLVKFQVIKRQGNTGGNGGREEGRLPPLQMEASQLPCVPRPAQLTGLSPQLPSQCTHHCSPGRPRDGPRCLWQVPACLRCHLVLSLFPWVPTVWGELCRPQKICPRPNPQYL